jgi:glutamate/tyrosine decarboxylase-like PLP-dependent enzyme
LADQEEQMWLHVDAAYAGSAFVCPEFRKWMKGRVLKYILKSNLHKFYVNYFLCDPIPFQNKINFSFSLVTSNYYLRMFFLLANEIAFNPEFPCQGTEKRC